MRLGVSRTDDHNTIRAAAQAWVTTNVPEAWHAASAGGRAAIRAVRPRSDYEAWYPTFADSGMAVATWPVAYGGLDLTVEQAKAIGPPGREYAQCVLESHCCRHRRGATAAPLF